MDRLLYEKQRVHMHATAPLANGCSDVLTTSCHARYVTSWRSR